MNQPVLYTFRLKSLKLLLCFVSITFMVFFYWGFFIYEGPTENRLGELGSLYKYYYYYYYY